MRFLHLSHDTTDTHLRVRGVDFVSRRRARVEIAKRDILPYRIVSKGSSADVVAAVLRDMCAHRTKMESDFLACTTDDYDIVEPMLISQFESTDDGKKVLDVFVREKLCDVVRSELRETNVFDAFLRWKRLKPYAWWNVDDVDGNFLSVSFDGWCPPIELRSFLRCGAMAAKFRRTTKTTTRKRSKNIRTDANDVEEVRFADEVRFACFHFRIRSPRCKNASFHRHAFSRMSSNRIRISSRSFICIPMSGRIRKDSSWALAVTS